MNRNSSSFNRRRFAQTTVAGAASLAATSLVPELSNANDPSDSSGWIDAHVHIWHPDTAKYPLGPSFKPADMQPPSFTPAELFTHCRPVGVDRIVLIQMSFYEHDHTYMTEAMQQYPGTFSGVALIDHRADDLAENMKRLASQGMKGFRLYSADIVSGVDDPGMAMLWSQAAKHGLAICPLINPSDIHVVDTLCQRFPETTVVIDHFARVGISGSIESESLDALCGLAKHAKTHVKTSAFYALGKKTPPYTDLIPMIRTVVDAFGPERLMWASDCPYQVQGEHDYESSIALIRDRVDFLSDSDKRWMLSKTAEKVFFA